MKAHKYWSIGAVITMFGTFCTGYKGSKTTHKYLALSSLICMVTAVYTGHKMISGNKKTKRVKQAEAVDRGNSLSKIGIVIVSDDDKVGLMLCAK